MLPSGLVMTRVPDVALATATKRLSPYVTSHQAEFAADALDVQLSPSGLVMTVLVATATKRLLPYVTDLQNVSTAGVRAVHVFASALVTTHGVVSATATHVELP